MENKVKCACLFVGPTDHWHEGIIYPDGTRSLYKCSCMEHQSIEPLSRLNPDPLHNDGDYWRLVKGMMKHEGWEWFTGYTLMNNVPLKDTFTRFTLLDPARFIDLIWDFTGQEEVQEAYGWEPCLGCGGKSSVPVECSEGNKECGGAGKLPAPWLKVRREG